MPISLLAPKPTSTGSNSPRGSGGPAISWVVSRLARVEVTHLFTILPNLVSATRGARCGSLSRDATSQRQTLLFLPFKSGKLSTTVIIIPFYPPPTLRLTE